MGLLRVVLEPEEDLEPIPLRFPTPTDPPLALLGGKLVPVGVGGVDLECVALVTGGGGVGFLLEPRLDGRLIDAGSTMGEGDGALLRRVVVIGRGLLLLDVAVEDLLVLLSDGGMIGSKGLDLSIPFGGVPLLLADRPPPLRRSSNIWRTWRRMKF